MQPKHCLVCPKSEKMQMEYWFLKKHYVKLQFYSEFLQKTRRKHKSQIIKIGET